MRNEKLETENLMGITVLSFCSELLYLPGSKYDHHTQSGVDSVTMGVVCTHI